MLVAGSIIDSNQSQHPRIFAQAAESGAMTTGRCFVTTMKRNESITHIMSTGLATIHVGEPISKARQIMRERSIHHLPVVSGHKLIGILSWSDILRVSFGDVSGVDERAVDATLDHTLKLEDVMQKEVRTLKKSATIRDAGEILAKGQYHAVPVVDSDDETLVGMVTSSDLIRYLVDQM